MAPQCGLAPGLIGIIGKDLTLNFDTLRDIELRVGALPRYPNGQMAYSFTWSPHGVINEYLNDAEATKSYNKMFYSYIRTFNRLGLKAIPMAAETGPIGGDLSHEFIILAETGESQIYADKKIFEVDLNKYDFSDNSLQKMREDFSSIYAVTDEKYKEKDFNEKVEKRYFRCSKYK